MFRPVLSNLWFAFAVLLLPQFAVSAAAFTEPRLALVMGLSGYRAVPALPNPENDAKGMAAWLRNRRL